MDRDVLFFNESLAVISAPISTCVSYMVRRKITTGNLRQHQTWAYSRSTNVFTIDSFLLLYARHMVALSCTWHKDACTWWCTNTTCTAAYHQPVVVDTSFQFKASLCIVFAREITEGSTHYTNINEGSIAIEMSNLREGAKNKGCQPAHACRDRTWRAYLLPYYSMYTIFLPCRT